MLRPLAPSPARLAAVLAASARENARRVPLARPARRESSEEYYARRRAALIAASEGGSR